MRHIFLFTGCFLGLLWGADSAKKIESIPEKERVVKILKEVKEKNSKGIEYYYKAQFLDAIESFEESISLAESIDNQESLVTSLQNIGLVFFAMNQDARANAVFEQALHRCEVIGLEKEKADAWQKLGLVAIGRNESGRALKYFNEAALVYKKMKDEVNLASVYNGIGMAKLHEGSPESLLEAEKNFLEALKINRKKKAWKAVSANEENLSEVALLHKNYPLAIEHAQRALDIGKQIEDSASIGGTLGRMSKIFWLMGEKEQSYVTRQRAYGVNKSLALDERQAEDLGELVKMAHQLKKISDLENYQKEYEKMSSQISKKRRQGESSKSMDGQAPKSENSANQEKNTQSPMSGNPP